MANKGKVRSLEIGPDGESFFWSEVDDSLTWVHRFAFGGKTRDTILTVSRKGVDFEIHAEKEQIYMKQLRSENPTRNPEL